MPHTAPCHQFDSRGRPGRSCTTTRTTGASRAPAPAGLTTLPATHERPGCLTRPPAINSIAGAARALVHYHTYHWRLARPGTRRTNYAACHSRAPRMPHTAPCHQFDSRGRPGARALPHVPLAPRAPRHPPDAACHLRAPRMPHTAPCHQFDSRGRSGRSCTTTRTTGASRAPAPAGLTTLPATHERPGCLTRPPAINSIAGAARALVHYHTYHWRLARPGTRRTNYAACHSRAPRMPHTAPCHQFDSRGRPGARALPHVPLVAPRAPRHPPD